MAAMHMHVLSRRRAGTRTCLASSRAAGISHVTSSVTPLCQYGCPVFASVCSVHERFSSCDAVCVGGGGRVVIATSATSSFSPVNLPYELGRLTAHSSRARVPDEAFCSSFGGCGMIIVRVILFIGRRVLYSYIHTERYMYPYTPTPVH